MEKFLVHKSKGSWKCLPVASAKDVSLTSQRAGSQQQLFVPIVHCTDPVGSGTKNRSGGN